MSEPVMPSGTSSLKNSTALELVEDPSGTKWWKNPKHFISNLKTKVSKKHSLLKEAKKSADDRPLDKEVRKGPTASSANHRVRFNVGGRIFEAGADSLKNKTDIQCLLCDPEFLAPHWNDDEKEYFFDRDPVAFQFVLDYIRTGTLHLPINTCSPQITSELKYWGMPREKIEPCCWKEYTVGISSLRNLQSLEKNRMPSYMSDPDKVAKVPRKGVMRWRRWVWMTISDPEFSYLAKVYGGVFLCVVTLSLFTFALLSLPSEHLKKQKNKNNTAEIEIFEFLHAWKGASELDLSHMHTFLSFLEFAICCAFILDLLLQLTTCPNLTHISKGLLIDVIALVPDITKLVFIFANIKALNENKDKDNYLTYFEDYKFRAILQTEQIHLMKFFRVFRVFRLVRRVTGMMVIIYTLIKSIQEIASLMSILMVTAVIFASFVYYAENMNVPNPKFSSIWDSLWYSLITLTTVGFGNTVPQTVLGQILGSACAIWGVLLLGITIPTMVNNFTEYYFLLRYIEERETIYQYRKKEDFETLPDIPCPEFL